MTIEDVVKALNDAGHEFAIGEIGGWQATSNKGGYYRVVSVVTDDDEETIELEQTKHPDGVKFYRSRYKYFGLDVAALVAYLNSKNVSPVIIVVDTINTNTFNM